MNSTAFRGLAPPAKSRRPFGTLKRQAVTSGLRVNLGEPRDPWWLLFTYHCMHWCRTVWVGQGEYSPHPETLRGQDAETLSDSKTRPAMQASISGLWSLVSGLWFPVSGFWSHLRPGIDDRQECLSSYMFPTEQSVLCVLCGFKKPKRKRTGTVLYLPTKSEIREIFGKFSRFLSRQGRFGKNALTDQLILVCPRRYYGGESKLQTRNSKVGEVETPNSKLESRGSRNSKLASRWYSQI